MKRIKASARPPAPLEAIVAFEFFNLFDLEPARQTVRRGIAPGAEAHDVDALLAEVKKTGGTGGQKLDAVGDQSLHVHLLVARGDDLRVQSVLLEDSLFHAEVDWDCAGDRPGRPDPHQRLSGGGNDVRRENQGQQPKQRNNHCEPERFFHGRILSLTASELS
jgi:hypothetical protein